MEKTMVGFDIGSDRLKIFVADKEGAKLHEVRLPERMVENGVVVMPNAFSDFLKKIRNDLKLPRCKAALAVPSGQTICRLVTMPRMTEDQLLLNLPYEFSEFINGEPERYFCDYALCEPRKEDMLSEENDRMTMMAAIISKEQSNGYVRMFSQAGIKLEVLLPQEMCLLQLSEGYRRKNPDGPREYCFVDLGHTATRVTLISGDRVQAVRQINIGGQAIDRIVADELGVDMFLANSYKLKNYQGVLEHPRCMDLYGNIAVELLKVFNFYQYAFRENNLEGIYLIGGGANVLPLRQAIGDTLSVPLYRVGDLLAESMRFGARSGVQTGVQGSVQTDGQVGAQSSAQTGAKIGVQGSTRSGVQTGAQSSTQVDGMGDKQEEAVGILAASVTMAKGAKK